MSPLVSGVPMATGMSPSTMTGLTGTPPQMTGVPMATGGPPPLMTVGMTTGYSPAPQVREMVFGFFINFFVLF